MGGQCQEESGKASEKSQRLHSMAGGGEVMEQIGALRVHVGRQRQESTSRGQGGAGTGLQHWGDGRAKMDLCQQTAATKA